MIDYPKSKTSAEEDPFINASKYQGRKTLSHWYLWNLSMVLRELSLDFYVFDSSSRCSASSYMPWQQAQEPKPRRSYNLRLFNAERPVRVGQLNALIGVWVLYQIDTSTYSAFLVKAVRTRAEDAME
jgi:hypothetical protein